MDLSFNKLTAILANVLEVDQNKIKLNTSPDDIDSWDSYNGLAIVTELEKYYRVEFTIEEIVSVKDVNDIVKCLISHDIKIS